MTRGVNPCFYLIDLYTLQLNQNKLTMKRKTVVPDLRIKLFLVTSLLLVLVWTGCKHDVVIDKNLNKQVDLAKDDPLISSSKDLLTNQSAQPTNSVKVAAASSSGSAQKGSKKINTPTDARMSRLSKNISWTDAKKYTLDGVTYLIVPVNENIKPFSNKHFEFVKSAIFYNNGSGLQMSIIEVLSKKDISLGSNLSDIVNACFSNMYFKKEASIPALSANVIFYDKNYVQTKDFRVDAGTWKMNSTRFSFRSDLNITE